MPRALEEVFILESCELSSQAKSFKGVGSEMGHN